MVPTKEAVGTELKQIWKLHVPNCRAAWTLSYIYQKLKTRSWNKWHWSNIFARNNDTWRNFQFWRQIGLFNFPSVCWAKSWKFLRRYKKCRIFSPWVSHNTKAARELIKKIICHYVQQLRHKTMQMFTENQQPANRQETPCCIGMSKVHHRVHKNPFFCIIPWYTQAVYLLTYLLTYLLHGAESFLRS